MATSLDTRLAQTHELPAVIDLSARVQAKLTAARSEQRIGPLEHHVVEAAIAEGRLFVATLPSTSPPVDIIGLAFIKPVSRSHFPIVLTPDFNELKDYPEPWWYMHSLMLDPEAQSKGLGKQLFDDVLAFIRTVGFGNGSLFVDCWAGSDGLRAFYQRCGCRMVVVVPKETWEVAFFAVPLTPP